MNAKQYKNNMKNLYSMPKKSEAQEAMDNFVEAINRGRTKLSYEEIRLLEQLQKAISKIKK